MAFRPGFRRVWLRAGMVEETRASVPPGSDVVKMGLMRAPWLVRDGRRALPESPDRALGLVANPILLQLAESAPRPMSR
jgi:hypothetical protein